MITYWIPKHFIIEPFPSVPYPLFLHQNPQKTEKQIHSLSSRETIPDVAPELWLANQQAIETHANELT